MIGFAKEGLVYASKFLNLRRCNQLVARFRVSKVCENINVNGENIYVVT